MNNTKKSTWILYPLDSLINYLMPEEEVSESNDDSLGFDLLPVQTLQGYKEFVRDYPEAHRMGMRLFHSSRLPEKSDAI